MTNSLILLFIFYGLIIPVAVGILEGGNPSLHQSFTVVGGIFWPITVWLILLYKFWMAVGCSLYFLYKFGKKLGNR